FLPNNGNGTYTLYAKATDAEGHQVTLGSKTINCDNANAVKPFGAIDTPAQGGTASGHSFINWGWVLTPQPNTIPTNGSTINVYVDGVNLGHPTYNIYRSDIAALFPGYANSNGAAGYFYLDTTAYDNGVHTIQWTAVDDAGNTDGIGSRYFTIQNTGSINFSNTKREQGGLPPCLPPCLDSSTYLDLPPYMPGNVRRDYPIAVIKGYNINVHPQKIYPDDNGMITIEIREMEPLEIHLEGARGLAPVLGITGYQVVDLQLRPLPVGSTLDVEKGVFYWIPPPGFVGSYQLLFIGAEKKILKRINIKIVPKDF
ncbi:MAG: hypothetical protein JSV88_19390, partial [Candidatus Aminicenantes bacterium]